MAVTAQEKRAMGVADFMKFEQLASPSISRDGHWVAHAAEWIRNGIPYTGK